MSEPDEPEEVAEYIVESQRGWVLLGYPFFTPKLLLALDPHEFSARDGSGLGHSLHNVNVPDDTWEWAWPKWFVDMANDVDDQGWLYSWRFRSKDWKGYPRHGRSFVRQRQWKRLRRKKPEFRKNSTPEAPAHDVCEDVIKLIATCNTGREQVDAVSGYLRKHPDRVDELRQNSKRLFGSFVLPVSEHEIMRRLAEVPAFVQKGTETLVPTSLSKKDDSSI